MIDMLTNSQMTIAFIGICIVIYSYVIYRALAIDIAFMRIIVSLILSVTSAIGLWLLVSFVENTQVSFVMAALVVLFIAFSPVRGRRHR